MGTFAGHLIPGSFFIVAGVWWMYNVLHRFFLASRWLAGGGKGAKYRSTATFTFPCCPKLPLEGLCKVVITSLGMAGELGTAFENGKFTRLGNAQHMTMYFFFGMNGAMDVLTHYRLPLPPDTEYLSAILAFLIEGLLFYYHLHGRAHMDVQLHMLLFYVVLCCAVSTMAEMYNRRNVLPALCRTYFTLLQGTWFLQIGFILYPPLGMAKWDENSHNQMMLVTLAFCWHNAAIFVFMMLTGFLVYLRVKSKSSTAVYRGLREDLTKMDAEQVRHIIASEESEAEDAV